MDSIFRDAIEKRVTEEGIFVLDADESVKGLIKTTDIVINGSKINVSYLDIQGALLCEFKAQNKADFPCIGKIKETNTRKKYLADYEKNNIKVIKIKCNKEKDRDIIEWAANQDNIQAAIKELIRAKIREK